VLERAGLTRSDVVPATGFVLAALVETWVLHRGSPALLALGVTGAPVLGVLAVRRTRPVVPICVVTAFAVLGSTVQAWLWPDTSNGGGVWLFALMFAAYSLGVHAEGPAGVLGGLLPLVAGLAIDVPTMTGWALVNGELFLTTFVGILPTIVGRAVRVRRARLAALEDQRQRILLEQRVQREAVVLRERLETADRLRPALLDGLRDLAAQADDGADAGQLERVARHLLGRTREEVLALTAPVELPSPTAPPPVDVVSLRRAAAQPWAVLGAGVIGAGLALESTGTLSPSVSDWVAVAASLAVGAPLALMWWRPLAATGATWVVAAAFSRLVAPLDGTLSATALALGAAFAVATLCSRRGAIAGLLLCWCGQVLGLGTDDPFGVAMMILVCWLGGLAVAEISTLVEQSRINNSLLVGHETLVRERAVVEERLRMARDLHDQVGHSLTVVALQAAAARRMAATDPERTRAVMETIAAAARGGVTAMKDDAHDSDMAALLERTRAAGLDLTADVADLDEPGLLDPATREVAYRIVQEALTNVLRHAPGARASVRVRRHEDGVSVTVRNGAPTEPGGLSNPGSGRGLPGLRERVAGRAGLLSWGPRGDGGFQVHALLPVHHLEGVPR
jgi:signal transduction histidine kinase